MNQPQAILTGALLIASAIFATQAVHPAAAFSNGPYQLMHHSNTGANAGVFRLDTVSGEVSYCYITGQSGIDLTCSKPVQ